MRNERRNLCLSLPALVFDRLDAVAREQDRPRSYVVAKLIESALPAQPQPRKQRQRSEEQAAA